MTEGKRGVEGEHPFSGYKRQSLLHGLPASTLAPPGSGHQSHSWRHDPCEKSIRFHHSLISKFQQLPYTPGIKFQVLATDQGPYMMGPCYIRDLPPSFHASWAHHLGHSGLLYDFQTCQASSHLRTFANGLLWQSYIEQNSPIIQAPCPALFLHTALRTMTLDHKFGYFPVYYLPSLSECKHPWA